MVAHGDDLTVLQEEDPVEVDDGADSLRWYLMISGAPYLPKRFDLEAMRDNANKFLGTLRNLYSFFALYAEIDGFEPSGDVKSDNLIDRWILSRLNKVITRVSTHINEYRLDLAAQDLYEFIWHEYCGWYLELTKPVLQKGDDDQQNATRYTLLYVLESSLRTLHPIMPFITEEI